MKYNELKDNAQRETGRLSLFGQSETPFMWEVDFKLALERNIGARHMKTKRKRRVDVKIAGQ